MPRKGSICTWPLTSGNSREDDVGSSVSEVTEGISTFNFCFVLNELYFAVWVSPVVQSSSPVVQSSSPVQWLYPPFSWIEWLRNISNRLSVVYGICTLSAVLCISRGKSWRDYINCTKGTNHIQPRSHVTADMYHSALLIVNYVFTVFEKNTTVAMELPCTLGHMDTPWFQRHCLE